MKRKNTSSPVTSVNLKSNAGRLYYNYYFAIVVLVVMLVNLVLMLRYQPL